MEKEKTTADEIRECIRKLHQALERGPSSLQGNWHIGSKAASSLSNPVSTIPLKAKEQPAYKPKLSHLEKVDTKSAILHPSKEEPQANIESKIDLSSGKTEKSFKESSQTLSSQGIVKEEVSTQSETATGLKQIAGFTLGKAPDPIIYDLSGPSDYFAKKGVLKKKKPQTPTSFITKEKERRLPPALILYHQKSAHAGALEKLAKAISSHFACCECCQYSESMLVQIEELFLLERVQLLLLAPDLNVQSFRSSPLAISIDAEELLVPGKKLKLWNRISKILDSKV